MTTVDRMVYIMRGIPGSGKSTVAGKLARQYSQRELFVATHSTDELCMVDGEYQFDIELAPARHEQNYQNFLGSLENGIPSIIVDNTNIKTQHYSDYVKAAQAADYAVVFVEVAHPPLDVAVERNTHDVPREVINQMVLDWEPSQHNAIVEDVNRAAAVVKMLQSQMKGMIWFGVGVGSLIGAFVVNVAWLIWSVS